MPLITLVLASKKRVSSSNASNNKGYTDLQQLKSVYTDKGRSGEFGNEVNAPFDKFFDKLRALSKKGVYFRHYPPCSEAAQLWQLLKATIRKRKAR